MIQFTFLTLAVTTAFDHGDVSDGSRWKDGCVVALWFALGSAYPDRKLINRRHCGTKISVELESQLRMSVSYQLMGGESLSIPDFVMVKHAPNQQRRRDTSVL